MTLPSGSRLGPYEIVGPLGAGGMGEVYRARDTRLAREVAIKVLPAVLAGDASRLKRFEKEARSASGLNHPNIVTVYDIGSEGGVSYIAMEMVEGETLRRLLVGGAMAVKRLFSIAVQIAEGLSKAHEAGIVHRDLKPENVMVTKGGLVKILDFGLAKPTHVGSGSDEGSHLPTETGTSPGMIVGTVGYMSPEQASGELLDFRSDQFSFGSILYELATGKRAFLKKTGVDTLAAILNEEPEAIGSINPQIPAPLRWIVERCHAKDPEGRYASTKDLASELRTLSAHLGEASSSSATAAVARPSRMRRVGAVALPVILAATLGIVATKWISGARSEAEIRIRQVTFRREGILSARFAPDGQTIVYSLASGRDAGTDELVSTRVGSPESRSLGVTSALLQSISSSGELAVVLGIRPNRHVGTLASFALAGGAPREILENVYAADWAPDGRAMAVLRIVEGKKRLEFPIGRVLYESPGRPRGPRVSPKGDRVAVIDGQQLILLDLSGTKQTLGTVQDFAWFPSGDEILVNELVHGATTFRAVSLAGRRRFLTTLPGDIALQDVSREGTLLLERAEPEDEMIGRSSGDKEERNLSWLDGSIPVDISADGKTVLFNETGQGGEGGAVYLRRTDGSQAVRLGDGEALALSPDGAWALCRGGGEKGFVLIPTGAGQPRALPFTGLDVHSVGNFFPDSRSILILASEASHKARLLAYDTSSLQTRPLTKEATTAEGEILVSPDGRSVLASRSDGRSEIYELSTGRSRPVAGVSADLYPIKWCSDSRSIFVRSKGDSPVSVARLDTATGAATPWREFSPTHVRRGQVIVGVIPAPDGESYVYVYDRYSSDLFLLEGLK